MQAIKTFAFSDSGFETIKKDHYGLDWPVVYFIENGKEAYIGETIHLYYRSKEHYKNKERQRLHQVHVVTDEEYNKSAALDIESWLIQYIAADGIFKLQNGNAGLKNHEYFDREKYLSKFENGIWPKLVKMGLAKNNLVQLKNSDLFKYSPYKTLSADQIAFVEALVDEIAQEKLTFVVRGRPGTGKTIVAVYLMKYLKEDSRTSHLKVGLVIPMTSLRKTLKNVFKNIVGLSPSMVIGPADTVKAEYDLLLVDETHRLRRRKNITNYKAFDDINRHFGFENTGTELDWIQASAMKQVYFYDEQQSVRPSDIRPSQIARLQAKEFTLQSQMRVRGGERYLAFIDSLFGDGDIRSVDFPQYDLRMYEDISLMVKEIKEKDEAVGLARMVAGYAWSWKTRNLKPHDEGFDIEIDGEKLRWNSTNADWVNSENAVNEVGCIHTVQGYDLNYVGVIIGPELKWVDGKFVLDRSSYFDKNGHRGVENEEEIIGYVLNIYKTLLTRGIIGTFIYVVDPGLRNYLKNILNQAPKPQ
ncbi:hypothetical protein COV06_02860 [Candidatus Uhrbacteria bacterium CG10_big_fil_rev_8_21_14_0_10_50_16]|uniref:GIY-YIG domain-containing protein n=1 Tax=Candidatus Uhrbacteria bacterium CG10_big_fil_rev_8_21_14_0_10_50_16 TaxID=1975039 RepID=A0A2H0RM71_9BACT|nr:MAG: hypothetical protein COV06_02860 [Candidatus Uhrbacteria bacterium CG10_big_fil_rev_8_21_14_0_10_50_16]